MAATLFGLTVEETIAGATREAASALGRLGDIGTLERGKWCDLAVWDIERPAELAYASGSIRSMRACGEAHDHADAGTHNACRLARGWPTARASVSIRRRSLRSSGRPDGRRHRRARRAGLRDQHGFGKTRERAYRRGRLWVLQRNIVLSHAAGVGEPMQAANVRLMMALKLASLCHGASGVRPQTIAMLEAMLERGILPLVPSQGSVGTSGDLAPLAHLAATMLGIGEARFAGETMPADAALGRAGLAPLVLGPKEGLALLNGTQFSTAEALAGLFTIERVFHAALITGALTTDAAKGSDTPFDARIHALRGHRGQIEVATALRTLMAGSPIRASHLVNDDRVQDPYCLRCQPQVMGAVLDLARQAAATLAIRGQWRLRQPADFRRQRRGAVGRQFPRRAGGVRRRHAGDRNLRDRLARRAAGRHAD
jgi:hypothetical protein